MQDEPYTETTNTVAALVPCDPKLVRCYAAWGWIECRTLASGMRLFRPSAPEKVRRIRAERIARRGRYLRNARPVESPA
ncbi:MAG TPA: hypothetical protein VHX52_14475 [Steroidobacteraceae bacterium]|jgi:hypothetical protein|nr:hypothetical protein [Steroidobacteraceae bacterium]